MNKTFCKRCYSWFYKSINIICELWLRLLTSLQGSKQGKCINKPSTSMQTTLSLSLSSAQLNLRIFSYQVHRKTLAQEGFTAEIFTLVITIIIPVEWVWAWHASYRLLVCSATQWGQVVTATKCKNFTTLSTEQETWIHSSDYSPWTSD